MYYDPTYMVVAPDGDIIATSNNFQAVVQFADASGVFHVGLVQNLSDAGGFGKRRGRHSSPASR